MQYTVSTIFRGVDMMTGIMKKMAANSTTFAGTIEKNFRDAGVRFERLNSAIRGTIASGVAWGAAIGVPMVSILKTGAEFEDTLIRAFAKLDETIPYGGERFKELKNRITEATVGTEFFGVQAAGAFQELAGAGYSVEKSIRALPTLFKASRASQMELNETSTRMVDLLKAFNLEATDADANTKQMARAANILAKADAMGTTNMRQLFEAIQNGGSAAVRAGADLETFGAMAINLADIKGLEAGTGLKIVFSRLISGEKIKNDLLNALDIRMEDPKRKGKLRDYVDILEELQQKLSKKTDYQRAKILNMLFGVEGAAAGKLMEVFRALPGKVRESRTELRGMLDQLDKLNREIEDSPMQKWKVFRADMDRAKNKLYDRLKPAAMVALTRLTTWLGSRETQDKLAGAMIRFADKIPMLVDRLIYFMDHFEVIMETLVSLRIAELLFKLGSGVFGLYKMVAKLGIPAMLKTFGSTVFAGAGTAALAKPLAAFALLTTAIYGLTQSIDAIKTPLDSIGKWIGSTLYDWLHPDDKTGGWTGSSGRMAERGTPDWATPNSMLPPQAVVVSPQQSKPQSSTFRFYSDTPNLKAEPMPQSWEPGGLKLIQSGAF